MAGEFTIQRRAAARRVRPFAVLLGFSVLLAVGLGASQATAETSGVFGSLSLVSIRDCGGAAPSEACNLSPQRGREMTGGAGVGSSAALQVTEGPFIGGGTASVEFAGPLDLPILHGTSYAYENARVNASPLAYQSFRFDGPDGTPFGVSGVFDVLDSSASPADSDLAGGAAYGMYLAIFDAGAWPTFTDARSIYLDGPGLGTPCGDAPGLLAMGYSEGTTPGGAFSSSVSTTSCGTGPLTLNHGQEVVVLANVALFTNRGGYIDFSHTFTTMLDPKLGDDVIQVLSANLVSGAVPEPGTWALMICGFGLAGAALRRQRQVLV